MTMRFVIGGSRVRGTGPLAMRLGWWGGARVGVAATAAVLAIAAGESTARSDDAVSSTPIVACGKAKLQLGQATCDGWSCADLHVSAEGKAVTVSPPAPSATPACQGACAKRKPMTVEATPDLRATGALGAIVRLDFQADGYEDGHTYVRIETPPPLPALPAPVCVVLNPRPNLRVTLDGQGAAGTLYAELAEGPVDRCTVDTSNGRPTCDLYVPVADGESVQATLRIVGTVQTELPVAVRDGVLTEVRVSAPRTLFSLGTDLGVGLLGAAGVGLGLGLGGAGQSATGGDIGLDVAGAAVTAATLIGEFALIKYLGTERVRWTYGYRCEKPCGPLQGPNWETRDAPAFAANPSRPRVTAGVAPSGFAVRW